MLAFFLQHFPAAGLVHSPSILPAAVEKETQRPAVPLCEADQPFSGLLGFRMKCHPFFEELAPSKRLRAAGGFEALPDGVLGTVVDFLVPVAQRQRRRIGVLPAAPLRSPVCAHGGVPPHAPPELPGALF